jgi:hypothetical protein
VHKAIRSKSFIYWLLQDIQLYFQRVKVFENADLKSAGRKAVGVQVPLRAP